MERTRLLLTGHRYFYFCICKNFSFLVSFYFTFIVWKLTFEILVSNECLPKSLLVFLLFITGAQVSIKKKREKDWKFEVQLGTTINGIMTRKLTDTSVCKWSASRNWSSSFSHSGNFSPMAEDATSTLLTHYITGALGVTFGHIVRNACRSIIFIESEK